MGRVDTVADVLVMADPLYTFVPPSVVPMVSLYAATAVPVDHVNVTIEEVSSFRWSGWSSRPPRR